jgi:hypothetical protein
MERLAGFEHHVVGDIDHVVNRANTTALESVTQPHGRGRNRNVVDDPRRIPGAQPRVFDGQTNPFAGSRIFFGRARWHRQ